MSATGELIVAGLLDHELVRTDAYGIDPMPTVGSGDTSHLPDTDAHESAELTAVNSNGMFFVKAPKLFFCYGINCSKYSLKFLMFLSIDDLKFS